MENFDKIEAEFNKQASKYLGRTVVSEFIKNGNPSHLVPNIHLLTTDQEKGGQLMKMYNEIYKSLTIG
jgi:hypothetical protein